MRWLIVLAALTTACSGSSAAPSPATPPAAVTPPAVSPPIIIGPKLPIRDPSQFDLTFWKEFVYNGFESPTNLSPLRRLTAAPMLYLKTVDEAGHPIDFATLNTVQTAMRDVALTWGGGVFGLAGIQQGTGTMEGQPGWLTVKWPNPSIGALCGRSDVGLDGGVIELNYLRQDIGCGCGASALRTRTARHELGHAFGYWHTDSDNDVMRSGVNDCAEVLPSAREVYHATIAYRSPVGSIDRLTAQPRAAAPVIVD